MKLATANADCNRCLDVQSSLVKELCLRTWLNQDQASTGMKTGLATQTAQKKDQFRTRIAMTAAVQLVEVVP